MNRLGGLFLEFRDVGAMQVCLRVHSHFCRHSHPLTLPEFTHDRELFSKHVYMHLQVCSASMNTPSGSRQCFKETITGLRVRDWGGLDAHPNSDRAQCPSPTRRMPLRGQDSTGRWALSTNMKVDRSRPNTRSVRMRVRVKGVDHRFESCPRRFGGGDGHILVEESSVPCTRSSGGKPTTRTHAYLHGHDT